VGFNREKELETVLRVKGYKSDSKKAGVWGL